MSTPEDAFRTLLNYAEPGDSEREGLVDTPTRAARAWTELTSGYDVDIPGLFTMFESNGYDEMIAVKDIYFYSTCEHHLESVIGTAHVAYVPNGRIVGLSKIARLVDAYARRLQVQERMTVQIADSMMEHLGAQGVAVVLIARHLCMERRGVQKPGAVTTTSALRGVMFDKPATRAEALQLLLPR